MSSHLSTHTFYVATSNPSHDPHAHRLETAFHLFTKQHHGRKSFEDKGSNTSNEGAKSTSRKKSSLTGMPLHSLRTARGYHLRLNSLNQTTRKTTKTDDKTSEVESIAKKILCDPITEVYSIDTPTALTDLAGDFYAEVSFLPGTTDNTATTLKSAITDLFDTPLPPHTEVRSTMIYVFTFTPPETKISQQTEQTRQTKRIKGTAQIKGTKTKILTEELSYIVEKFLKTLVMNPLIEHVEILTHDELVKQKAFPSPLSPLAHSATTISKIDQTKQEEGVPFKNLSSQDLLAFSKAHELHLSLDELQTIQKHYLKKHTAAARQALNLPEEPTRAELEAIAQTWSEHCKHKIFNATIKLHKGTKPPLIIRSLYRTYIQALTKKLKARSAKEKKLLSVFSDNAGVFAFNKDWGIAMKVETHNTPAALDPFGGALTGIVGVNRDILGTGMGANPLFNTNVFCLADPRIKLSPPIPTNAHPPQHTLRGVHLGVERGGNESGIPTVNGAIVFDDRFLARPLVFCGTGGLLERKLHDQPGTSKDIHTGDYIVTAGGDVGRDGIHGATASSSALHSDAPGSIVQIGDPITQKKLSDFLKAAKAQNLIRTLTDNGAGGLSSSVGELASTTGGADLDLEKVPLKVSTIAPWEILVSESQERMTLAVPPAKWKKIRALAELYDTRIAHIGTFTNSQNLIVRYGKKVVAGLPLKFLHDGLPEMILEARMEIEPSDNHADKNANKDIDKNINKNIGKNIDSRLDTESLYKKMAAHSGETWLPLAELKNLLSPRGQKSSTRANQKGQSLSPAKKLTSPKDFASVKQAFLPVLNAMLARGNIASKESWVRRYDHEVKARTVVKPMSGSGGHGVNNAAVIRPLLDDRKALSIANGVAPRYSQADTFAMAAAVVDEAVRNLVAVGTDPRTIVGLDNFAWPDPLPSPDVPDSAHKLAQLVRCVQGLYETCLAYEIPLISGKDSMKNDVILTYPSPKTPPKRVSIPPTLLFTALGTFPDIAQAVTAPFVQTRAVLYLAGTPASHELRGSEYSELLQSLHAPAFFETPSSKENSFSLGNNEFSQAFTLPKVDCAINRKTYEAIYAAAQAGLLLAAHDPSDGGLLCALAECAMGGLTETDIDFMALTDQISSSPYNFDDLAYNESPGRMILQVHPDETKELEEIFAAIAPDSSLTRIGETHSGRRHDPALHVHWQEQTLSATLRPLRKTWLNAIADG